MNMQILTTFFMWCSIINGSILLLWAVFFAFAPDLVYAIQNKFIPIPRESYNLVMYSFLGLFKILFLLFNLIPYLALVIIG
jgi:hypothetical protein